MHRCCRCFIREMCIKLLITASIMYFDSLTFKISKFNGNLRLSGRELCYLPDYF